MRIEQLLARGLVAGACAAVTTATCAATGLVGPPYPTGAKTTIASGRMHGVAWTVKASAKVGGGEVRACFPVSVAPPGIGGAICGRAGFPIHRLPGAPRGFPYGVGLGSVRLCSSVPFYGISYGPVVSQAREVTVQLTGGLSIRTKTIPAPPGTPKSVRFYVVSYPCPAMALAVVARDAHGRVVGRFQTPAFFAPTGSNGGSETTVTVVTS